MQSSIEKVNAADQENSNMVDGVFQQASHMSAQNVNLVKEK